MSTLRKLGNSAGTIIPAAALNIAGFNLGDELNIEADEGQIIIKKASPSYSLEQLLEGVTPGMTALDDQDKEWLGSSLGKELIRD